MNVAIMCCCLPPLRPLATRLWRKLRQSKLVKHSRRFAFPRLSGLSSFIGTGKLSLLFPSYKSKTTTATSSKADNKPPGEYSHGAKSKGSDGITCSNTDTNDISTVGKSLHGQVGDYDGSRMLDDVAINNSLIGSLTRSNAATPDISAHNNEKSHDLLQHRSNVQDEEILQHYGYNRNEYRRSSISWLSITETVYDECSIDRNYHDYSGNDVYDSGFPGTAV